jgi:hypothetical protein
MLIPSTKALICSLDLAKIVTKQGYLVFWGFG